MVLLRGGASKISEVQFSFIGIAIISDIPGMKQLLGDQILCTTCQTVIMQFQV